MAKLVVITPGLAGLSLELGESWAVIGRGNGNALQIIETSVSGKHCEVQLKGNELNIRDLRSTNGTHVRGQKVTEAVLKPGQILRLGQVELRFEMEPTGAAVPQPPASVPPRPVVPSVLAVPTVPVVVPPPKAAPPMGVPVLLPAKSAEIPVPAARRYHVLFVDDNETFLAMFTELCGTLSNKQWEMHTATTADRALEILRKQNIDLVIVDIGMPLVDGIQLMGIIKRRYHDLKVAVLTGMASEANRAASLSGGAEIFIEKPMAADGFKVVFNMLNDLVSWSPQQREGFSGTVRQVGLQEVIQMECLGRHSSVLEVRNQLAHGQIYIEAGALVHAETTNLSGEKALQLLLSLAGGEFRLLQFKAPKTRTINGGWEFLLMEAARLRDEEHHTSMITRNSIAAELARNGSAPAPALPGDSVTSTHVPMISSDNAAGAPKPAEAPKEAPVDSNVHALGDDVVVVATYDGKWHPSNSPKK